MTTGKIVGYIAGVALIVGGAWIGRSWGDSAVVTAAGIALVGAGAAIGGWVSTPPAFAKKDPAE